MNTRAKKAAVINAIVLVALIALSLGALGVTAYFLPFGNDSAGGLPIAFDSDTILMRSDAVTAPFIP